MLARLEIATGSKQLWRILNATTDAFLNLAIVDNAGIPLPLEVVARDGAPLTDDAGRPRRPVQATEPQMVPPSGRIEILVAAPRYGVKAYLVTRAVDTGCVERVDIVNSGEVGRSEIVNAVRTGISGAQGYHVSGQSRAGPFIEVVQA